MNTTYATTGPTLGSFTMSDVLAAMEKMRAIPKPPALDDVVLVIGDDVTVEDAGPCVPLDAMPVRIVRSPYAKGITPLPASLFDLPKLDAVEMNFQR